MSGNGLIVDDVISSGSSLDESINIIRDNNAHPIGILVALDRMELGKSIRATSEIEKENNIAVHSIINIDDVVLYLEKNELDSENFLRMKNYLDKFKR